MTFWQFYNDQLRLQCFSLSFKIYWNDSYHFITTFMSNFCNFLVNCMYSESWLLREENSIGDSSRMSIVSRLVWVHFIFQWFISQTTHYFNARIITPSSNVSRPTEQFLQQFLIVPLMGFAYKNLCILILIKQFLITIKISLHLINVKIFWKHSKNNRLYHEFQLLKIRKMMSV